jgi:hypothetical protein
MDATLHPARRIIARLLQEDAASFREHHYLNPLGVDDSDNPMLCCSCCVCTLCIERESFSFLTSFVRNSYSWSVYIVCFGAFAAILFEDT